MSHRIVLHILPLLTHAHVVRRDRVNHVVVTGRANIRRNGRHRVLCGPVVDRTWTRRPSTDTVRSAVTCPRCFHSMTGLADLMDDSP